MEAIYARQSVDKADSLSIQGQIDLCQQHITGEVQVYQDKGFSGKNTKRPAFQAMMEDVKAGVISKIVVYRLDRFSRSLADFSNLWEELQRHKVEFVSVNETFDTTNPIGRAMLSIVMVFAQLERETTAERVRDNYYQRTKLGAWPGGKAPYGFDLGKMPDNAGKLASTLIPNGDMATVQRVFALYAQGDWSLGQIARRLNDDGIAPAGRKTWDNVNLSRMLHSPLYAQADEDVYIYYQGRGANVVNDIADFDGTHAAMLVGKRDRSANKYQDVKDQTLSLANHAGVISSDTWLKCQYKLAENRRLGGNGRGKHTWLTGLLKCAKCGYSIKVNKDARRYYLVCSGRSNFKLCDASMGVRLEDLEASIAMELDKQLAQCPDTIAQETPKITMALAEIDQKIDRLVQAMEESSDVSIPYINRRIDKLDKERQTLLSKAAEVKPKPVKPAGFVFDDLSFEEKKIVASTFIEKILVEGDNVEVVWKV